MKCRWLADYSQWQITSAGNGLRTIFNKLRSTYLITEKNSGGNWVIALSPTNKALWKIQPTSEFTDL
jgi:hypothetical protein